jgi:hypothetical protein
LNKESTKKSRKVGKRQGKDPIVEMVNSPSRVITARIAKGLDQWMNDYVHSMYPEPITKKALLEEALVLLIKKKGLVK